MARGSGSASGNGMQSSAAVKRILKEVAELATEGERPGALFTAAPLESDLFEMHFTVRGPPETAFEGGLYHGRILLPPEYPLKAPEIMFLTPNGRFETGTRICLSVTSHHEELWQPSWGIRTILTALVGFMPSKPTGLGALDYPDKERAALAKKSLSYVCPRCGAAVASQLPPLAAAAAAAAAPAASPAAAAASAAAMRAAAPAEPPAAAAADVVAPVVPADGVLVPTDAAAPGAAGAAVVAAAAAATLAVPLAGPAGTPVSAPAGVSAPPAVGGLPPVAGGAPDPTVGARAEATRQAPASPPGPAVGVSASLRRRDGSPTVAAAGSGNVPAEPRRPTGDRDLSNDSGGEETLLMAAWFVACIIGGLLARRLARALF